MGMRKTPLVNGETYHIFNRSVGSIPIFNGARECSRFIFGMTYYQNISIPLKLSKFNRLARIERENIIRVIRAKKEWIIELIAYCIMPSHFHLVVKQLKDH